MRGDRIIKAQGEFTVGVPAVAESRGDALNGPIKANPRHRMRSSVVGLAVLFVMSSLAGSAFAHTLDSTYLVFLNDVNWCIKGRAELRHPSLNVNYIMDYNSYIQGWNGSCSALKSFNAGSGQVMAILHGPGGVCRSFSWVSNPSSTNTFGIGAPANAWCNQGNYWVWGAQYFNQGGSSGSGSESTSPHGF